ncbi:MAG TPA: hypothetical protein VFQ39_13680 [Longimicrobium sp.]|nr:hypothetical protein [Longimicrobium sp.]
MRKLKLDPDSLAVESFDTRADSSARGTLRAHDSGTAYTVCWGLSCPGCGDSALAFCTVDCPSREEDTCYNTCQTCGNSCDGWHTCAPCTPPDTSPMTCMDCPSTGIYDDC